jgi:hypothetical protein
MPAVEVGGMCPQTTTYSWQKVRVQAAVDRRRCTVLPQPAPPRPLLVRLPWLGELWADGR